MKGTHKHTATSLKHFHNHRCFSQSEECDICTVDIINSDFEIVMFWHIFV